MIGPENWFVVFVSEMLPPTMKLAVPAITRFDPGVWLKEPFPVTVRLVVLIELSVKMPEVSRLIMGEFIIKLPKLLVPFVSRTWLPLVTKFAVPVIARFVPVA